jgi:hypothetical protein
MKNAGNIKSFLVLAASLAGAIVLIITLEQLFAFDGAIQEDISSVIVPRANWTYAIHHHPIGAYLWMLLVDFIGGLTAGLIHWALDSKKNWSNIFSVILATRALIHLSYTPNPFSFWILAPIAISHPVYIPGHAFRNQKIQRIP